MVQKALAEISPRFNAEQVCIQFIHCARLDLLPLLHDAANVTVVRILLYLRIGNACHAIANTT